MNHVTTLFNSNEFGELRTIIIENEVYFVAKSVATALGYKDTADAIRKHIDEEDKLQNMQGDAYKYIGDNVRTIRHRMRKLKGYSCTVRD